MILWLNPIAGLSGDMLLGALLDLGAPLDAIQDALAPLRLPGWELVVQETERHGLRALRAEIRIDDDDVTSRPAAVLLDLVGRVKPSPVAEIATRAVQALADAEATIHRRPVGEVHLHEIGSLDTIIDTVGVAAAVHALGVRSVWSAPIALGTGTVKSAHGLLPIPAPATSALLVGALVHSIGGAGETVTPTGAALLHALDCSFQPLPPMTVRAVGYGAGSRDPEGVPNILPVMLGSAEGDGMRREPVVVLETTVDDVTGEAVGSAIEAAMAAGALDAWVTPATGKKSRPALVVSVLAEGKDCDQLVDILARHTATLGIRRTDLDRYVLPRRTVNVSIDGKRVRVKVGPYGSKAERDDVTAASEALGVPPGIVAARACEAARHES